MIENFRPLEVGDGRWFVTVVRESPEQYRADEAWSAKDLLTVIGWCDGLAWSVGRDEQNRLTPGDVVVFDDRYGRLRSLHGLWAGEDGLGAGRNEVIAVYITTPEMDHMNGYVGQPAPGEVRPYDWTPDDVEWMRARCRNPFSRDSLKARHPVTTYVAAREVWAKIGRTTNLDRRMVALSTVGSAARPEGMTPGAVRLVFTFVGDVEETLHRQWAEFRVPGTEWFRLEGGFAEWLAMEESSLV